AAVGDELFFAGNDGGHSTQLWSSNGAPGGTGVVADINGASTANGTRLTNLNGTLFFTAYTNGAGYQVWQSDGTSSGTVQDTSLNTGNANVPTALVAMGNALYFTAPGATMWQLPTTGGVKTTPTTPWPSPPDITFGTPLSSTQLDATASVPGTFSYSPPAGTVLGAGTKTLSATFTPTNPSDSTSVTATTTITVAQNGSKAESPPGA